MSLRLIVTATVDCSQKPDFYSFIATWKQTNITTIGGKPTNQPFYTQVKYKDKALIFRHGNVILVK